MSQLHMLMGNEQPKGVIRACQWWTPSYWMVFLAGAGPASRICWCQ